jgi:hypothetical protein
VKHIILVCIVSLFAPASAACPVPVASDRKNQQWEIVKPPGTTSCAAIPVANWDLVAREHVASYSSKEESELALQRLKSTPDPMAIGKTICE